MFPEWTGTDLERSVVASKHIVTLDTIEFSIVQINRNNPRPEGWPTTGANRARRSDSWFQCVMFKTLDRNLMHLSGASISHRHRIRNGSGKLCREGLLCDNGCVQEWMLAEDRWNS